MTIDRRCLFQMISLNVLVLLAVTIRADADEATVQRKPRVIVGNHECAGCLRRLVGDTVEVCVLRVRTADQRPSAGAETTIADSDVADLCDFDLFIADHQPEPYLELMWRQRLATGNPQGRLRCIARQPIAADSPLAACWVRAVAIHAILAETFPHSRANFDANLATEYGRLQTVAHGQRLVAVEGRP